MNVKSWMGAVLLICLCGGMSAREQVKPFVRIGIGTALYPEVRGLGGDMEAGIHYKGMECALALTLYNSDPIREKERWMQYSHSPFGWGEGVSRVYFQRLNYRSTSLCLTFGYDVLRLIPRNERHHLILSVGVGWSGENIVRGIYLTDENNCRYRSEKEHAYNPTVELPLGARYEYSLNARWGVGVTYKMHCVMGRDFFGAHAVYHF